MWIHVRVPERPILFGVNLTLASCTSPVLLAVKSEMECVDTSWGCRLSHTVYMEKQTL